MDDTQAHKPRSLVHNFGLKVIVSRIEHPRQGPTKKSTEWKRAQRAVVAALAAAACMHSARERGQSTNLPAHTEPAGGGCACL